MVKLHTTLLALTLASTGSALASSNEHQRRSELVNNQVESRGFEQGLVAPHRHLQFGLACTSVGQNNIQSRRFEDEEDLFVRDIDAFDDLEAREPSKFGSAGKVTTQVVKGLDTAVTALSAGQQIYGFFHPPVGQNNIKSRGFEDDEDLFVRDIGAFDDLEAREPFNYGSAAKAVEKALEIAKKVASSKTVKGLSTAATAFGAGQQIYGFFHPHGQNNIKSREFEDEEDLFVRYINALDDLEAREPSRFGSAGKVTRQAVKGLDTAVTALSAGQQIYGFFHPPVGQNNIKSRGFEDDEDLFVRDIGAFDDLEAREPFNYGSAAKAVEKALEIAKKVASSKTVKGLSTAATAFGAGQQIYGFFHPHGQNNIKSREFEDEEDLFVRYINALDDLEAREPSKFEPAVQALEFAEKIGKSKRTRRVAKGVDRAATAYDVGQQNSNTFQSRGLEDNEYIYGRDLDVEELFGREYDLLEERDAIDDLD